MKTKILSIIAAGLLTLSSCDMDLEQPGSITIGESVETAQDVRGFRNNIYGNIRALCSGSYVTSTELQSDFFMGLRGNGGRGSTMAQATFNPSTGTFSGSYGGCYGVIVTCNFLLDRANALLDRGTLDEQSVAEVKHYLAETKFMRAYIYYWLFDHFCQTYSEDKANTPALGLQLVHVFDPNMTPSTYPGRSTMAEVVDLVNTDLKQAFDELVEWEKLDATDCKPNAPYVSSYAVAALQARWALLTKDYATAIDKANYVIKSHNYALSTGEEYINMWATDQGNELIFVPFVNNQEAGSVSSYFDAFNYTSDFPTRVDYVPTWSVINSYADTDIRFDAFFAGLEMTVDAQPTAAFIFYKYPGNESLIVGGTNNYKNKPKPFRLSEQYLILAEAAQLANREAEANAALNTLRKARISDYKDQTFTGVRLRDEIRAERAKELIGEGFRISDLRRWGLGFTRDTEYGNLGAQYVPINTLFLTADMAVRYQPNDYRYTWAIPQDEFEVNPQLKGQQNPGY